MDPVIRTPNIPAALASGEPIPADAPNTASPGAAWPTISESALTQSSEPDMSDWKFGHEGANSKEPSLAYLKSVGHDPASEVLAKAKIALDAFADALAKVDDMMKRLDALAPADDDRPARLAKLNGGAK